MNIFISDKIEIEYDSREREFTVTMYDKYGHYIDSTKIDMDDMKALYESLNEIKNLPLFNSFSSILPFKISPLITNFFIFC